MKTTKEASEMENETTRPVKVGDKVKSEFTCQIGHVEAIDGSKVTVRWNNPLTNPNPTQVLMGELEVCEIDVEHLREAVHAMFENAVKVTVTATPGDETGRRFAANVAVHQSAVDTVQAVTELLESVAAGPWIPVAERMPPESIAVLIHTKAGNVSTAEWELYPNPDHERGVWMGESCFCESDVTHWAEIRRPT
jgi:hypothetical protein